MHDRRRRIWSPAFSDKALRGYETRLKPYSTLLAEQLKAFGGKAVDVSQWFNYFSYDAMGDLAFSESFGMLQKAEDHWAIKLLSDSMDPLHFHCEQTLSFSVDCPHLLTWTSPYMAVSRGHKDSRCNERCKPLLLPSLS